MRFFSEEEYARKENAYISLILFISNQKNKIGILETA